VCCALRASNKEDIGYRTFDYVVDLTAGTYTARRTGGFRPAPQISDGSSLPIFACVHRSVRLDTVDAAALLLTSTTSIIDWQYNANTGESTELGNDGRCLGMNPTDLGTHWFVTYCQGNRTRQANPLTLTSSNVADCVNYDFLYTAPDKSTTSHHDVFIQASGPAAFAVTSHYEAGFASSLLFGHVSENGYPIVCTGVGGGYKPSYDIFEVSLTGQICDIEGCMSPLLLDLNGDGIHTTSAADPVAFDLDGDGVREACGWTDPKTEEAFLFLDLHPDHRVENGRELFGTGTRMPDGGLAKNGFEALAVYDLPANGGNGDGRISREDAIWGRLRLWIDRDHDGVTDPANEVLSLDEAGVQSIDLNYSTSWAPDINLNDHRYRSMFTRQNRGDGPPAQQTLAVHDVLFLIKR